MSDLTAELNLALCVDDDDTADYLTQTAGLRGSLSTIDGLFSSTTGHNHSGAHQGGGFTSLNLAQDMTVGRDLTVNGTAVVIGNTHLTTLQSDGLATLNSLDVTTTSHLRGAVTLDATLAVTGTATAASFTGTTLAATLDLTVGRNASVTGSLTVSGGLGAGVITATGLTISGDPVATLGAAQTLNNKTLNSPTLAGTVAGTPTWNSAQAFPANTTVGGDSIVRGAGAPRSRLVTGVTTSGSVANNSATPIAVSFGYTFSTAPDVVVSLMDSSNRATHDLWGICRYNVTTTGMTIEFLNRTGSQQTCFASWIAFGGA